MTKNFNFERYLENFLKEYGDFMKGQLGENNIFSAFESGMFLVTRRDFDNHILHKKTFDNMQHLLSFIDGFYFALKGYKYILDNKIYGGK